MSERPIPPTLAAYFRRRRWALILAFASVTILGAGLLFRIHLETYFNPRLTVAPGGLTVLHGGAVYGAERPFSHLMRLDDDFRPVPPVKELQGFCRARVGDHLVYPRRITTLDAAGPELDQDWDVVDALPGPSPGSILVFGARAGDVLMRRVEGEKVSKAEKLDTIEGEIADVRAFLLEDGSPALALREQGSATVRLLFWEENGFRKGDPIDLPGVRAFTPAAIDGRILMIHYARNDRAFGVIRLRVACCASCGKQAFTERFEVADPVWIGRRITGLDAVRFEEGLLLAITRPQSLHLVRLGSDIRPKGELVTVRSQASVKKAATYLWPAIMLFFSVALISLGGMLLGERRRFLMERIGRAAEKLAKEIGTEKALPRGPRHADILQRAVAFVFDSGVLLPVWMLSIEIFSLHPDKPDFSLSDPGWRSVLLLWAAMIFSYHFLQEWLWGRTLGKLLARISVRRVDGGRVGFTGALVRNLVRIVDANFALALVGIVFMLGTRERRRLGDLAAGTVVLDDSVTEPKSGDRESEVENGPSE